MCSAQASESSSATSCIIHCRENLREQCARKVTRKVNGFLDQLSARLHNIAPSIGAPFPFVTTAQRCASNSTTSPLCSFWRLVPAWMAGRELLLSRVKVPIHL